MSIRDIFEMLNSRIQRDTLCALFSIQGCSLLRHQLWTLRIQSEDLPLTVKAKENCRSVIAKLFEENPFRLFLSLRFTSFMRLVQWRSKLVFRAISQLFNLSIPSYYFSANSHSSQQVLVSTENTYILNYKYFSSFCKETPPFKKHWTFLR